MPLDNVSRSSNSFPSKPARRVDRGGFGGDVRPGTCRPPVGIPVRASLPHSPAPPSVTLAPCLRPQHPLGPEPQPGSPPPTRAGKQLGQTDAHQSGHVVTVEVVIRDGLDLRGSGGGQSRGCGCGCCSRGASTAGPVAPMPRPLRLHPARKPAPPTPALRARHHQGPRRPCLAAAPPALHLQPPRTSFSMNSAMPSPMRRQMSVITSWYWGSRRRNAAHTMG